MIVRSATTADVAAVASMERDLFGDDGWSDASVLGEVTGARRFAVVAVAADEVVGYAITVCSEDIVDLQRIAVLPSYRRQGLAHSMLRATLDDAQNADRMLLEVSAFNTGALAFYAVEGFAEIDRRRRYYRDGSDALVLARRVVASSP